MDIVDIRAYPLRPIPLREPFPITYERIDAVESVTVRIETSDGAVGFGEAVTATLITGETQGTIAAAVDYLAAAHFTPGHGLLGRRLETLEDARAIAAVLRDGDGVALMHGNTGAKAGIEQAMLDLLARRDGTTYRGVLGLPDAEVVSAATAPIKSFDEVLAIVAAQRDLSPPFVRFKLGGTPMLQRDIDITHEIDRLVAGWPVRPRLVADANQGYAAAEDAVTYLREVDGILAWLEQPCPTRLPTAFAEIRPQVSTPLMADESIHGLASLRLLNALGGVDLVNVKLMKCGGVLSALAMFDEVRARGLRAYVGSMIESGLGTAAAVAAATAGADVVEGNDTHGLTLLADDPWDMVTIDGLRAVVAPLRPAAEMDDLVSRLRPAAAPVTGAAR